MRAAGARRSAPCGVNTSDGDSSLGNERRTTFASASCATQRTGIEIRATPRQPMARSFITLQFKSAKEFTPICPMSAIGLLERPTLFSLTDFELTHQNR